MKLDKEKIKLWFKDPKNLLLVGILLFAAAIRIYYFFHTLDQPLWWDEADYTSTAKRIGLNLDVNDVWYYRRTFFLPLLWAGLFALGGGETTLRLTELIFSISAVFLTYFVGKELFNKNIGLFAAFGLSICRIHLFLTGRLLSSLPAATFILAGLFFFWKGYIKKENTKYLLLAGLFFGLGFLTRLSTILSLIPLAVILLTTERFKFWKNKHILLSFLIVLLILSPFLYLYYAHYGGPLDFIKHYTGKAEYLEGIQLMGISGIWQYFMNILPNSSWPIFIFFLFGVVLLLLNLVGIDFIFKPEGEKIRKSLFIITWILIPIIVHGTTSVYLQERYLLLAYPLIFSVAGLGIAKTYNLVQKRGKTLAVAGLILILAFSTYSQISTANDVIILKKDSYLQVKQSGEWLKANSVPGDVIISHSRQHNYYTERSVYSLTAYEKEFEEQFLPLNPKYFVVSVFEKHPEWAHTYAQRHNETMQPVKVYTLKEQPSLVIYEFLNRS